MQKNLKILAIILLILGSIFAIKQFLPQMQKTSNAYMDKIKNYKLEDVKSIVISKNQEKITILKEKDLWWVEGKRGDKEKIEELLRGIFVEKPPELIAQTDQKHKEFEVLTDTGTTISLDDKIKIILGKSIVGDGVYARIEGDNNVYLLRNLYSSSFSSTPSFWMDKIIVSIDQTKLKKIEFIHDKNIQTILYKDNRWIDEKTGVEVNKDKMEPILFSLSQLKAESVLTSENKEIYPSIPILTIKLEADNGGETLEFYQGKDDYKVKRLSDKEEFLLTKSAAEKLVNYKT